MASSLVGQASIAQNIVSSDSQSVDCTGTDVLVVLIEAEDGGAGNPAVSAITYAGAALTLGVSYKQPSSTMTSFIYYKLSPATGTNTLSITYSGNTNRSVWILRFTGIPSPTVNVTSQTSATASTSHTHSITTTVADELVIAGHYGSRPITSFSSATMTRATAHAGNNYGGAAYIVGSHAAGSKSYTFSYGSSGDSVQVALSFAPAAGDTGDGSFLALM